MIMTWGTKMRSSKWANGQIYLHEGGFPLQICKTRNVLETDQLAHTYAVVLHFYDALIIWPMQKKPTNLPPVHKRLVNGENPEDEFDHRKITGLWHDADIVSLHLQMFCYNLQTFQIVERPASDSLLISHLHLPWHYCHYHRIRLPPRCCTQLSCLSSF